MGYQMIIRLSGCGHMEYVDIKEMDKFLKELSPKIYKRVYFKIRNHEDAKDITQEVLIRIYQHLEKFHESAPDVPVLAWVNKVINNICIDYYRVQKESMPIDDFGVQNKYAISHHQIDQIDLSLEFERAINQLPDHHRQVIKMKYYEEKTQEEIAELMNIPLSSVKTYISRARKKLKAYFERCFQDAC